MTTRTITSRDVGTTCTVVPDVGADGVVSLRLHVEDSHLRRLKAGWQSGRTKTERPCPPPSSSSPPWRPL